MAKAKNNKQRFCFIFIVCYNFFISHRADDDYWVPQGNLFNRAKSGPRGGANKGQTGAEKARVGVQQRQDLQSCLRSVRSDPHEDSLCELSH